MSREKLGEKTPASYAGWAEQINRIMGNTGDQEAITDLLVVRKVDAPMHIAEATAPFVNVVVKGRTESGFSVRVRGRWPHSRRQLQFVVAPCSVMDETEDFKLGVIVSDSIGNLFSPLLKDYELNEERHDTPVLVMDGELSETERRDFFELLERTEFYSPRAGQTVERQ
jgi:hypothetical protein